MFNLIHEGAMTCNLMLIATVCVGAYGSPSVKTERGSMFFRVDEPTKDFFFEKQQNDGSMQTDSFTGVLNDISTMRSTLDVLASQTEAAASSQQSVATELLDNTQSSLAETVSNIAQSQSSLQGNLTSQIQDMNASISTQAAQISDLSLEHFTGIRLLSTVDSICGNTLSVIGYGFRPGVVYTLNVANINNANQALSLSANTTMDMDRPVDLHFVWDAIVTEWMGRFQVGANVTVSLMDGSTEVPYKGIPNFNVAEILPRTQTIRAPASQIKYAERTSSLLATDVYVPPNTRPTPLSGQELVTVNIVPMSNQSRFIITATVTATEHVNSANNWFSMISVRTGNLQPAVYCSGVEEAYTATQHFLQTMYITCVISNSQLDSPIRAGTPTTVSLRAGIAGNPGDLCVGCIATNSPKGAGALVTTLIVQEQGPMTNFTCEEWPEAIHTVNQHVFASGTASGVSSRLLDMNFHRSGNVKPAYQAGHLLHTLTITPSSEDSLILIEGTGQGVSSCSSNDVQISLCAYSSATQDVVACSTDEVDIEHCSAYQQISTQNVQRIVQAGTTQQISFELRIGASRGSYFFGSRVNGHRNNPNPILGGSALTSTFSIREIKQYSPSQNDFADGQILQSKPATGTYEKFRMSSFKNYRRLGGAIPWNANQPSISNGAAVGGVSIQASTSSTIFELKCQGWMVESFNTADHTTLCIFADRNLLSCGTEEDTYGQQRLHGCHAKHFFRPGHTRSVSITCRGGANGGSADYNGHGQHGGNFLGDTLHTQITANEIF